MDKGVQRTCKVLANWVIAGMVLGVLLHILWHEGNDISWSLASGDLFGFIPSHVLMFMVHVFLGTMLGIVGYTVYRMGFE